MLRRGSETPGPLNHLTGALAHCVQWVTSSMSDVVYNNPEYNSAYADQAVAIYCVHGTADRGNAFKVLSEQLLERKLPPHIISIHLCSFDQRYKGIGIPNFAAQLGEKIQAGGHARVIVMGHSRGGVVASYYAEYLAADRGITVNDVFAFAAPFSGSDVAMKPLTWMSQSVDEMRTDSPLLAELRERMRVSARHYHFFAAEKDLLVPLHSTHIQSRAEQLTMMFSEGHLSMMGSSLLADHVMQRLIAIPVLTHETLCTELSNYINELKKKSHVWSADEKITLLERLHAQLNARDFSAYPDAQTLSDFINAFMQDTQLTASRKAPAELLNQSLNMPFSFMGNSTSFNFVSQLLVRYATIPLVRPAALAADASYKQIQPQNV